MKADVKSASAPAPQLHVPSWVPAPIAQYVKTEYAADVDRIYKEALRENGYFDDVDDDAPLWLIDELVQRF